MPGQLIATGRRLLENPGEITAKRVILISFFVLPISFQYFLSLSHPPPIFASFSATDNISSYGSVMAQITTTQSDPNGNHDSGYAPSNIEDILAANVTPPASPHQATIFVNRNVHYNNKTKNGSTSVKTKAVTPASASPKKEPFR